MIKPTPGPWKVSSSTMVIQDSVKLKMICNTLPILYYDVVEEDIPMSEATANAYLIAAAPDLLAACKPVLNELKQIVKEDGGCDHSVGICWCDVYRAIENLEKAIAKAEGK